MSIFFSSDYHFGDDRLHLFPRPFECVTECEETIIYNHNRVVGVDDTVYVLGDVALKPEKLELLNRMNGVKHLIKGNYDIYGDEEYLKYFATVQDELQLPILGFNLVHYPSKAKKEWFNLVGHIHGSWRVQKNSINVGVDVWNYRPYSVKNVDFLKTAIHEFYDTDCWAAYDMSNMFHMNRGKAGAAAKGSASK